MMYFHGMMLTINLKTRKFGGKIHMLIGIPTEIKNNENRVGLTPGGTELLVKQGNK